VGPKDEVQPEQQTRDKAPLVLIPVTAEDAARQKRRVQVWVWTVIVVVLAGGAYGYKRWTDPIQARQSYEAGMHLYAIARYPQAILAFERATDLDPRLVDAQVMLGRACVEDNQIDRAIAELGQAIEKRPGDAQALLWRGRGWLELKEYQLAVQDADRALAADSRLAAAYHLRALGVRGLGDPRKALEDFTRALELAPDSKNYFQRGATYQMLGEHRKAVADFDRMLAIQPDAASAYYARAESRLALGDREGAEQDRTEGRSLEGR